MNKLLKKSLLSFYIYSFSELTQYYYNKSYNLNDSYKRVFLEHLLILFYYATITNLLILKQKMHFLKLHPSLFLFHHLQHHLFF